MELFQPPIGLSESLVFRFVELFQPQEEIPAENIHSMRSVDWNPS